MMCHFLNQCEMELSIDVLEISRLPFSKLETLYFCLGLAVTPRGKRINSRVAIAKPKIKIKPNRFKLYVHDREKSSASLILYNYRTDGSNYPIAIISIPMRLIQQRAIVPVTLAMKPLIPIDIGPVIKMELVLTRDFTLDRSKLQHAEFEPGELSQYIVQTNDEETCEKIMYPGVDSFGQLTPPSYIANKWHELFKNCEKQELLRNLFVDDVLRGKVMSTLREFYESRDWLCVSDAVKCDSRKHKTNEACALNSRGKSVETNYISTNALEFEMPTMRGKSKKLNVKVKQHQQFFHLRRRSIGDANPFNPAPPRRDEELPNPRRPRMDDVDDPIRIKKSADDVNLPDIARARHYVAQLRPKNEEAPKRTVNESPPKQIFARTLTVKHSEPVQSKKSGDIEISKPMIRGQQMQQTKKVPESHEKQRVLLQKINVEPLRHESPPGKMRRILPETNVPPTPQKSLIRGLSSLPQKKPDEMEVKPPVQLSPMATRPKPPTNIQTIVPIPPPETGASPRRTRSNVEI